MSDWLEELEKPEFFGLVYKVTNLINRKIYIGQFANKLTFKFKYYLGSGKLITRAIKKYGKNNFKKEILEFCCSRKNLCMREIFWIAYYDSTNKEKGYNITKGGEGAHFKRSKETKEKMSIITIERLKNSKNHPMYGKHHTEETKKKMSQSHKEQVPWIQGKTHTKEARKKISNAKKGKSSWNKGKHLTDDHKQKLSESHKGNKPHNTGKKWINNGKESMAVKEKDLPLFLNKGFVLGLLKNNKKEENK